MFVWWFFSFVLLLLLLLLFYSDPIRWSIRWSDPMIPSDDPSDDPVRWSNPDFVDAALRCAKIGTRTQNVSIEKSCLTVDLTINCEFWRTVTSPKTFCWPVFVLNFACIERLNFDESRRICLFVMTSQIIILSGSHWKMKDSPTLILVKGKRLSAGESSKAFTFARKSHRNEIEIWRTLLAMCKLSFLGWNLHTVLVLRPC